MGTENKNLDKTFIEKLKKEKNSFVPSRSYILPTGKVDEILKTIKEQYEVTREEAVAILTVLFQQGATARGCDGNMTTNLFNKDIKLAEIRKILKQHSCNKSERKLARALANEIFEIALIMELEGNLYSKVQKQNLEAIYQLDEKVWMSDFQSENPNCPVRIRTLIQS